MTNKYALVKLKNDRMTLKQYPTFADAQGEMFEILRKEGGIDHPYIMQSAEKYYDWDCRENSAWVEDVGMSIVIHIFELDDD